MIAGPSELIDKMDDNEYNDPYKNYLRLIETIQLIKLGETIHPLFYEIHINHINTYIQVLEYTPEVDQSAMIELQILRQQYDVFNQFDLQIYLKACEKLLGNINEFEMQKMMGSLGLH